MSSVSRASSRKTGFIVKLFDFNTARRQDEPRDSVDLDDIRDRLNTNPKGFIEWLYSGRAYISKNQARIGNVHGEQGSSLAIDLTTGLWTDHATAQGGDLISLYRAWAGYNGTADFALSLKEIARDYLGDPVEIERPAWKPAPLVRIEEQKAKLGTKPRDENTQLGAPVATFTYYDLHGKVLASVVRFEPDGTRESKTFRPWCFKEGKWAPGAPDLRPLYRLPQIATEPAVVLCEGEGCAEALATLGIAATSAMQGAKAPLDKTDWSPLAGKTVTIWPDNDEPGFEYAKNVAARLAVLGCTVLGVTPPHDKPKAWDAGDCIADGLDPHELIKAAQPLTVKPTKPRIQILPLSEIENLKPPAWRIDNIITDSGFSVLWGRSGAMKSFVALDIGLCVAAGLNWHGIKVKQGPVIYVAAEGSHGLGRRAIGWWRSERGKQFTNLPFYLTPHNICVTSDDLDALVQRIGEMGIKPALIIIDTLARTFGAGDENKQADMNAYVGAVDRLRERTGAHVMIVHHSGVHEDRRERGSNVLRGAADTVIKIARNGDKIDVINQAPEGKQKDSEEFPTVKLRTQKLYFQHATSSEEQSTLILNLREDDLAPPDGDAGSTGQKLGSVQEKIIAALKQVGEPTGLTRLKAMTGAYGASLTRALETLVAKNIVSVDYDSTGDRQLWTLV